MLRSDTSEQQLQRGLNEPWRVDLAVDIAASRKRTRLRTLKNSLRNWTLNRSSRPKRLFLRTPKSRLLIPWFRTSGKVRLVLPKVKAGGWLKTPVLNQRFRRSRGSPEILAL